MIQQLINNSSKPAPKWYRKTKSVISLLSGPTTMACVKYLHLKSDIAIDLVGFLPTILEILNTLLVNGEEYAQKGTTDILNTIVNGTTNTN